MKKEDRIDWLVIVGFVIVFIMFFIIVKIVS
jgi:hypothetical protein